MFLVFITRLYSVFPATSKQALALRWPSELWCKSITFLLPHTSIGFSRTHSPWVIKACVFSSISLRNLTVKWERMRGSELTDSRAHSRCLKLFVVPIICTWLYVTRILLILRLSILPIYPKLAYRILAYKMRRWLMFSYLVSRIIACLDAL